MFATKYLELDSAYRNRNIDPNPSSFRVKVSQFGTKSQAQAVDPLTDAYAVNIFSPDDFPNINWIITAYQTPPDPLVTFTTPLVATTSNTIFVVKIEIPNIIKSGGIFIPPNGYFNGAILETANNNLNTYNNNAPLTGSRRILDSQLLLNQGLSGGLTNYQILWYQLTIESPFSGELYTSSSSPALQNFTIKNPSDLSTTQSQIPGYLFLPCSLMIQNFYNSPKYIIYNQTKKTSSKIIAYDAITHIASLSDVYSYTGSIDTQWALSDVYILRTIPPVYGNVYLGSGVSTEIKYFLVGPNTILLNPETPVNDTFINSFIRVYANDHPDTFQGSPNNLLEGNNVMRIIGIDSSLTTGVVSVTITNGGLGYTSVPLITFDPPPIAFGGSPANIQAQGTAILNSFGSVIFIVMTTNGSGYNSPPNVTFSGGGSPTILATGTSNLQNNTINVPSLNFPALLPEDYYFYEILQYSRDNVAPFTFGGSIAAQNKTIAQEVSLSSLTLPNTVLNNGGRIAFYPYIYVVLQNISSSSSANRYIIYSNNPNTSQAIFKIPITDMNQPLISPFVRMNGNGMVQTIQFKQNDDMFVSVLLPNGELLTTSQLDTSNGQAPNPLLQLSFCFSMNPV